MCVINVGTAKTSLLVCVWILTVCVEYVYCSLVPSPHIYSLRLLPHRDWSYHDFLTLCLDSAVCHNSDSVFNSI